MKCNFIGITTLHVWGSLSAHHQELFAVHRLCYIYVVLMTYATRSRMVLRSILLLVANGHHNCIYVPKPMYGEELLMMGRKAAPNM